MPQRANPPIPVGGVVTTRDRGTSTVFSTSEEPLTRTQAQPMGSVSTEANASDALTYRPLPAERAPKTVKG